MRRFARISSHTRATQSSVLLVVGLPDRGLSSTESRPSLNLLCHSKMQVRLKHCSPKAVQMSPHHFFPVSHKTWCTRAFLALPTSRTARTITRRSYTTLFDRSSQRTEKCAGTVACPRERGSSRTPPCKQGCPKVYPQPSKKISLGTFWSYLVHSLCQGTRYPGLKFL